MRLVGLGKRSEVERALIMRFSSKEASRKLNWFYLLLPTGAKNPEANMEEAGLFVKNDSR
jgi:hypothetical protein